MGSAEGRRARDSEPPLCAIISSAFSKLSSFVKRFLTLYLKRIRSLDRVVTPACLTGCPSEIHRITVASRRDRILAITLYIGSTISTHDRNRLSIHIYDTSLRFNRRNRAVSGYSPGAAFCKINVAISISTITSVGFIIYNSSGKCTVVSDVEVKVTDGIPDDIALHLLVDGGEETVRTIVSGLTPAALVVVAGAAEEEFAVRSVGDIHAVQGQCTLGVGGVEQTAVSGGKFAISHLEGAVADFRVTGHALVYDDASGAVILIVVGHISGEVAVEEMKGVQTLDADGLGAVGCQSGIIDGNISGAVNCRRTNSVGGIGSAFYYHGAAAAVAADGSCGFTVGLHVQIPGIESAAASSVDSTGGILVGSDCIVSCINGAVAVSEEAGSAFGISGDCAVAYGSGSVVI